MTIDPTPTPSTSITRNSSTDKDSSTSVSCSSSEPSPSTSTSTLIPKKRLKPSSAPKTNTAELQLPSGEWIIQEGLAKVYKKENVFYNPVQEFNRDLSIAVIHTWQSLRTEKMKEIYSKKNKPLPSDFQFKPKVLEALAATGLRSIRYAKEIPHLKKIICNDLDPDAVLSIRNNLNLNQITEELIQPNLGDANKIMYQHLGTTEPFDIIDLDPYGSAAPFLDAAIQSIADNGLLCVTCTDMQVLAGANYSETCFAKYGGLPLKGDVCHEMALRLLLGCIQRIAARHRKVIIPLMSCSIDFYIRVFVQLRVSPLETKKTASLMSMVFQCRGCKSLQLQPMGQLKENQKFGWTQHQVPLLCQECQSHWVMGGPIYHGPIHDTEFIHHLLTHLEEHQHYGTHARMQGIVSVISEELHIPLYYTLRTLTSAVHCDSISMLDLGSAILNANYDFSISHANPTGIKTNAPNSILWDIVRAHAKRVSVKPPPPNTVAHHILSKQLEWNPDFKYHPKAQPASRKHKLLRFQENPTKHWGPKARPLKSSSDSNRHVHNVPEASHEAKSDGIQQEKKDQLPLD